MSRAPAMAADAADIDGDADAALSSLYRSTPAAAQLAPNAKAILVFPSIVKAGFIAGAQATEPEVEYGWIEPGRPLAPEAPVRIWEIRRFWEKPSEDMARSCLEAGCLWNTFILVGKARTLIRAGRKAAAPAG